MSYPPVDVMSEVTYEQTIKQLIQINNLPHFTSEFRSHPPTSLDSSIHIKLQRVSQNLAPRIITRTFGPSLTPCGTSERKEAFFHFSGTRSRLHMHGNSSMIDDPVPGICVFQIFVPRIISRTIEASLTLRQKISEYNRNLVCTFRPTQCPHVLGTFTVYTRVCWQANFHKLITFVAGSLGGLKHISQGRRFHYLHTCTTPRTDLPTPNCQHRSHPTQVVSHFISSHPFGENPDGEGPGDDLSIPRKVHNHSNWKHDKDVVCWVKLSRAQDQGLRFWQTKSNARIVHNLALIVSIYKVISQNGDRTLFERRPTLRLAPWVTLRSLYHFDVHLG